MTLPAPVRTEPHRMGLGGRLYPVWHRIQPDTRCN